MNENGLILAIETASRLGSAAIGYEDRLYGHQTFSGPLRHSVELLPTVKTLIKDINAHPTDIKHIIISVGPGSFTGLRIAVATAKAMALANQTRIISVGTLDVIAANAIGKLTEPVNALAAVLDAKRHQFFIAGYDVPALTGSQPASEKDFYLQKVLPDGLMTAPEFLDSFVKRHTAVAVLGDGLMYHKAEFATDGVVILNESTWSPRADVLFHMGVKKLKASEFSDPLTLTPCYLRAPQVTLKRQ